MALNRLWTEVYCLHELKRSRPAPLWWDPHAHMWYVTSRAQWQLVWELGMHFSKKASSKHWVTWYWVNKKYMESWYLQLRFMASWIEVSTSIKSFAFFLSITNSKTRENNKRESSRDKQFISFKLHDCLDSVINSHAFLCHSVLDMNLSTVSPHLHYMLFPYRSLIPL